MRMKVQPDNMLLRFRRMSGIELSGKECNTSARRLRRARRPGLPGWLLRRHFSHSRQDGYRGTELLEVGINIFLFRNFVFQERDPRASADIKTVKCPELIVDVRVLQ